MERNYKNSTEETEARNNKFINSILEFAIENSMSFKEVETCICKVKEIYLSDGLIKK